MAVPTGILWGRDPHTAAKHTLLRRYMSAWFPIMANQFRDMGITFFDGFAGLGEYMNAQDSSPTSFSTEAAAAGDRKAVVVTGRKGSVRFVAEPRKYSGEQEATVVHGQRMRVLSKSEEVEAVGSGYVRILRMEVEFLED